ncbi:conserved hypothetical protein, partial [Ricinus communis]
RAVVAHHLHAAGAVHGQLQLVAAKAVDLGRAHALRHHLAQIRQHQLGARGTAPDLDPAPLGFQVQGVARLRRRQLLHVAPFAGDLQRRRLALPQLEVDHAVDLDPHHAGVDGDDARFGDIVGGAGTAKQRAERGKQQAELEKLIHCGIPQVLLQLS